jgi:hypothetical protein
VAGRNGILQKVDYKAEFVKLRYILESGSLAKIWVYTGRDHFSTSACPDAQAYVMNFPDMPEIRICIENEENYTYKDALVNLLHEYGHTLDEKQYKNTNRHKLCDEFYPQGSFTLLANSAKYIKVALVRTEYMASEFGKKVAKKFNISIAEDLISLDQTASYQSHYTKLVVGRRLTDGTKPGEENEWTKLIRYFKKTGIRVKGYNVNRLDNLLPEEYYL